MRHRRKINHLSRKTAHRRMMLANMASSLILHKRIHTTVAKAKALRSYIEPLITKSKQDNTHSRRIVFSYLQSKEAVTELFRDISVKVAERPGGYTRIIKTGARLGDNAEMCMMELVDYNENLLGAKESDQGKSTRRRRRGGKKEASKPATTTTSTTAAADVTPDELEETKDISEETKAEAVIETPEEKVVEAADESEETPAKPEAKEEVQQEEKKEEPQVEEPKAEPKAEVAPETEATEEDKDSEEKEDDKDEKQK